MAQQWRIGISGKQRKDVDVNLLIQAVIALGHQLREEERERARSAEAAIAEQAETQEGEAS